MVSIDCVKNSRGRSIKGKDKLTVKQLQNILKKYNLDHSGTKNVLIDRIIENKELLKKSEKRSERKSEKISVRRSRRRSRRGSVKRCSRNSKFSDMNNYICNEKTGRWIKIGGATYNKLKLSEKKTYLLNY